MVQSLVIVDVNVTEFYVSAQMMQLILDFALTYFYWWPSFACSLFPFFSFHIVSFSAKEEPLVKAIAVTLINLLYQVIALVSINFVIKSLGDLYGKVDPCDTSNG